MQQVRQLNHSPEQCPNGVISLLNGDVTASRLQPSPPQSPSRSLSISRQPIELPYGPPSVGVMMMGMTDTSASSRDVVKVREMVNDSAAIQWAGSVRWCTGPSTLGLL